MILISSLSPFERSIQFFRNWSGTFRTSENGQTQFFSIFFCCIGHTFMVSAHMPRKTVSVKCWSLTGLSLHPSTSI